MYNRLVTLLCLAVAALCLSGCGGPATDRPLRVGMELAYPPFEMTDTEGTPTGFSVDLAHALASHLGRDVEIRNTPFDGLIPALKTGSIDLIISSMTATDERARSIDFSTPYLRTGLALLAGPDTTFTTAGELNAAAATVAVKLGTTGHAFAQQSLPDCTLRVLNEENACVLEVVQGKADAFIYDQMSVYKNWGKNRDNCRAVLDPIRRESWAIGIRKGNDTLRHAVNGFLDTYRLSGGFEDLGDTYLGEMKAAFKELGYPFVL